MPSAYKLLISCRGLIQWTFSGGWGEHPGCCPGVANLICMSSVIKLKFNSHVIPFKPNPPSFLPGSFNQSMPFWCALLFIPHLSCTVHQRHHLFYAIIINGDDVDEDWVSFPGSSSSVQYYYNHNLPKCNRTWETYSAVKCWNHFLSNCPLLNIRF